MKDFKLDSNEKITSGFKIPDHYFDDFSEKVMQKLPKEESKVISFYARNKRWIYSAAAVLVLALSARIVYHMQNNDTEMTSSEVENYLVTNTTLSDDDIVNLLEQEDIDQLKEAAPIEKEALEEALSNNPEIEQYITN